MGRSLKIAVTVFLASMGIVSSVDAALIGATATFRETTPTISTPDADDGGSDIWTFSVDAAAAPGFYIQSLKWTLPSDPAGSDGVIFDTEEGGTGHGLAYDFSYVSGVNPVSISVVDGGKTLTLVFNDHEFLAGGFHQFHDRRG